MGHARLPHELGRGRFDIRDCVALRRSRRSESPIGGIPKRWRRKNGLEPCRHRGLRLYSLVEAPFTGITDVCVLLFSLHTSWIIACRPPKFASKSAKVQRTFSKDRARSSHCRPLHRHARATFKDRQPEEGTGLEVMDVVHRGLLMCTRKDACAIEDDLDDDGSMWQ